MGRFLGYSSKDERRVTHHAGGSCDTSCWPRQQGRGQVPATVAAPEARICRAASAHSVQGLCPWEGRSSSRVPAAASRAARAATRDSRVAPRDSHETPQQQNNKSNSLITSLTNSVSSSYWVMISVHLYSRVALTSTILHRFPALWLKRAASLPQTSSVSKTGIP